jgi:HK97 gp10 family phage protein
MSNFEFEDNSEEAKKQLKNANEAGMLAALLLAEASGKALAPVDGGQLRDTLDHEIETNGTEVTGKMGSPLDYAIYPEFGTGEFAENGAGRKGGWSYQDEEGNWRHTKGQLPQPYLRPAFRNNRQRIIDELGKAYGVQFKGK